MSSKKIIRLKTPSYAKHYSSSSKQPNVQLSAQLDDETIMKDFMHSHQRQNIQTVYNSLIDQLNKAYTEVERIRQRLMDVEEIRDHLAQENQILGSRLEMVEREYQLEREKYVLQRDNHERLRQFYEKREKEWMGIICQQKRMLDHLECYNTTSAGKLSMQKTNSMEGQMKQMETTARSQNCKEIRPFNILQQRQCIQRRGVMGRPLMKSHSASRNWLSPERQGLTFTQKNNQSGSKWISQKQLATKELKPIKQGEQHRPSLRNQTADEIFDKVLRKTIYRYKNQGKSLTIVEQSQEMAKLRSAKSSTRERLFKTIRKLRFEIEGEKELRIFCQHIEQEIIKKYEQLRGDFVHDFILEKLFECQRLAGAGSSSVLQQLEKQHPQSEVSISLVQKKQLQSQEKVGTLIDQLSQRNFQLKLASNVKGSIKIEQYQGYQNEISQVNRYSSDTSLRNLSDLINGSRDYFNELTEA